MEIDAGMEQGWYKAMAGVRGEGYPGCLVILSFHELWKARWKPEQQ
jgi:hypothetical protein